MVGSKDNYIHFGFTLCFKKLFMPFPGSSVCRFHLLSGHVQEATSDAQNKWNNEAMLLSLSLKSINTKNKQKGFHLKIISVNS